MRLLLNADGIIKLNRVGVLKVAVESFECIVPMAVYHEVVTQGRARRYPDADAIEEALKGTPVTPPDYEHGRNGATLSLGEGERAILGLLAGMPGSLVLTDDRRFINLLSAEGISFLTPADVLVMLARGGTLTSSEASGALDLLRPLIRTNAYWEARSDLEALQGEGHHGKN
jgi:hypothetical protein